jgi:hypothetical protein
MPNNLVRYKLAVTQDEAKKGTKKLLTRNHRKLEVTIPAGLTHGNLVKLRGALLVTDGYPGDIIVEIRIKGIWQTRILKNYGFWGFILGVLAIFAPIGGPAISQPIGNVTFFSAAFFLGIQKSRYRNSKFALAGFVLGLVGIVFFFALPFYMDNYPVSPSNIYTNEIREFGGDNKPIELINNPKASNPSYDELLVFVRNDSTDARRFVDTFFGGYVCSNYAEDVHNNAEAAGIRAAWVGIDFQGESIGHALNAFETTDKGLVYVDCTEMDTIAYVVKGEEYRNIIIRKASSIYEQAIEEYIQEQLESKPLGIVEEIHINW